MFVKWQDHVYDFEIMIWNHFSDSGKSNAPRVDHTHFMILRESIIQDGRDGVLHRFIWANQKIPKQVNHTPFKCQNESITSPDA